MSSAFWEQNLALLRNRYPELAKHINIKGDAGSSWRLEQTPTGSPTVTYRENPDSPEILIHSRRDPAREGQRQAEAALKESVPMAAGTIILLGFGLGYTADTLVQTGKALIIIERYPDLFRLAMKTRDLEALLSPGNTIFILGGEAGAVTAALALLEKTSPGGQPRPLVIKHRTLCTLTAEDESWYAETARQINTWANKDEINAATLRRFGKRWTKNLAANREGVLLYPGIKSLENILKETRIPVFLAAAGPSLNRVKPCLKEIQHRCLIVAVDTSLRFLIRQNVEPDFVLSVDPQFWNSLHLFRIKAPQCALIGESAVYPLTLRNPAFGRVFFCQSLFPLGRFVEDRCDPKGPLGAGGSVATTAWDFARFLGPGIIWTAGLDLAFPGYATHFKGALFEEISHAMSNRFCPAETFSIQALESGIPFYAPSAGNGKVLTDRRLSLYAAWFENRLEQFCQNGNTKLLTNYSLSPGGLAVQGLVNARLEDLLTLPPCRKEINSILQKVYQQIDKEFMYTQKTRHTRYNQALNSLVRGLEEIRNCAREAASSVASATTAASSAAASKNDFVKILEKLDKVDRIITQSPVKDAAGFLFPPIAEMEKELCETEPLKRHLEFSLLFYRSLEESADYTLKVLAK
ncbi:MAG: DUF115 domain-containing protein [Treponema sp.]|jgi:hypothetical protein|nr:DUF115 domain-containing protein [Treponema sp.]